MSAPQSKSSWRPKEWPDAAISIILSEDEKNVLLVQRRDISMWVLPGGGIEPGERPEDAAMREALEESGCTVRIQRKLAEISRYVPYTAGAHIFECRVVDGTPRETDESADSKFFPLNKLPWTCFPLHKYWIREGLMSKKGVIKRPMKELITPWFFFQAMLHPVIAIKFILLRFGLIQQKRGLKPTE